MSEHEAHWNAVFESTDDPEFGWYEHDVSQTLKFVDKASLTEGARIFLPGAGTSLLVDELIARGHELVLNDISGQALERLRNRIGDRKMLTWLHHDISEPLPAGIEPVDMWIDRAVLHFTLDEPAIAGYFANVQAATQPGGFVLLAEFSTDGARRCAGLDVHRYCLDEMERRIGEEFALIDHTNYTFTNPAGQPRPYIYALFRRHASV